MLFQNFATSGQRGVAMIAQERVLLRVIVRVMGGDVISKFCVIDEA